MKMVMLETRQNALTFYLFIVALEHISGLAVVVINVCSVVLQITLGCENEQSRLAAAKEGLRLSRQQMKDDLQLWQLAVSALLTSQSFLPVMANSRACVQIALHMRNDNLMLYVRRTPKSPVAAFLLFGCVSSRG